MTTCQHRNIAYFRHPHATGGGHHFSERCRDCGDNVRGEGHWVSRQELLRLLVNPEKLDVGGPARTAQPTHTVVENNLF